MVVVVIFIAGFLFSQLVVEPWNVKELFSKQATEVCYKNNSYLKLNAWLYTPDGKGRICIDVKDNVNIPTLTLERRLSKGIKVK